MRSDDILARVAEIKKMVGDNVGAHWFEDLLYLDVLAAIASGECDNPAECAAAALETLEFEFPRRCA